MTANSSSRLISLDAFRGITIAGMILVNNPGDWGNVYSPLLHAEWHGWTPTDFIFPFFLFIVGVSMVFSFDKHLKTLSQRQIVLKVARRALILFGLGLFLNGFMKFDLNTLRIPGVLQRIAVVYLIASLIFIKYGWRGHAISAVICLLGYWMLMMLVPVPEHGMGNLTVEGNLAAYIDFALLEGHTWKPTWDPEGILSTIPAIATTSLGILTGKWLKSRNEKTVIAGWMFVAGWILIVVGLFWDVGFPINKPLWTSSYVVFTAGCALQFLAFCYWLIDVQGLRRWAEPAVVYGMNSIAVFVASGMLARILVFTSVSNGAGESVSLKTWIYDGVFTPLLSPVNASLAYAVANILFWLVLMWVLHRKRIYIKV